MENNFLKSGERLDDLQFNNLKIIQNPSKYCFTSDAVLLANHIKAKSGDRVCDLGSGSGIIPIIVASKTNAKEVVGVEIQEDMAEMASRSILLNNLENKISICNENIIYATKILQKSSFDIVCCNPPFFKVGTGEARESEGVAISRHEVLITLEQIIFEASKLLKFGGKFYLVHKCERMAEAIYLASKENLQPKNLTLIYPKKNKSPDTFILECKLGAKPSLKINSLVVYDQQGNMTEQAKKYYWKD